MPSTVGACGVKKQESSCLIQLIECRYKLRDNDLKALIYEENKYPLKLDDSSIFDNEPIILNNGMVCLGIKEDVIQNKYFIISHNQGTDVNIECTRNVNCCDDECHSWMEIREPKIYFNDGDLRISKRSIKDKDYKFYYYDLFYRGKTWGAEYTENIYDSKNGILKNAVVDTISFTVGTLAGNIADFFSILRFINLPVLKKKEDRAVYDFYYTDCHGNPHVEIEVYPDVEFSLKIEINGYSNKLEGGKEKKHEVKSNGFLFDFGVKYGSVEKKFDFSAFESIDKQAENNFLYKTIKRIGEFFKSAGDISNSLVKSLEGSERGKDNTISQLVNAKGKAKTIPQDVKTNGKIYKGIGSKLLSVDEWLSGSLEIKPNISAKWYYDTTSDMRSLMRHIEMTLGVSCKGELSIDLVAIFMSGLTKLRKITTIAALGAAIVSGGLATILSALIKFLVDVIVTWIVNKLKEGFKFKLIIETQAALNSFKFDSINDKKISGLNAKIKPELRLETGLEYKSTVTLFIVTFNGEVNIMTEASTSLEWEMTLDSNEENLGVENKLFINPFGIKIGIYIVGAGEITNSSSAAVLSEIKGKCGDVGYKVKYESEWSGEWELDKIECDVDRWVLIEYENVKKDGLESNKFIIA